MFYKLFTRNKTISNYSNIYTENENKYWGVMNVIVINIKKYIIYSKVIDTRNNLLN